jgi:hypothetical protein
VFIVLCTFTSLTFSLKLFVYVPVSNLPQPGASEQW